MTTTTTQSKRLKTDVLKYTPIPESYDNNTHLLTLNARNTNVNKHVVVDGLAEVRGIYIKSARGVSVRNCPQLTTLVVEDAGELTELTNLPRLWYVYALAVQSFKPRTPLPCLMFLYMSGVGDVPDLSSIAPALIYLDMAYCNTSARLDVRNLHDLLYLRLQSSGGAETYVETLPKLIAAEIRTDIYPKSRKIRIRGCPNLVNIDASGAHPASYMYETTLQYDAHYAQHRRQRNFDAEQRMRLRAARDPGMSMSLRRCRSVDDFAVVAKYMFKENSHRFYFCLHLRHLLMTVIGKFPEPLRKVESDLYSVTAGGQMHLVYASFESENDPLSFMLYGSDAKHKLIPAFCVSANIEIRRPGKKFDVLAVMDLWTSSTLRECGVATRVVNSLKPWYINGVLPGGEAEAFWNGFGIQCYGDLKDADPSPPPFLVEGTEQYKKKSAIGDYIPGVAPWVNGIDDYVPETRVPSEQDVLDTMIAVDEANSVFDFTDIEGFSDDEGVSV